MTGTVKNVRADRGFAFVIDDATGDSYFLHATEFANDINLLGRGDRVEFEGVQTSRGLRAIQVRRLQS